MTTPPIDVARLPGRPCSAAAALELVGSRWALLTVRELLFGNHRFDQIARNTGAPRDRLALRLRALEAAGVVERRPYSERPIRFEYHLTQAGRDLAPVVGALRAWGDKWAVENPPAVFRHECGHELELVGCCAHCGEPVRLDSVQIESGIAQWTLQGSTSRTGEAGSQDTETNDEVR